MRPRLRDALVVGALMLTLGQGVVAQTLDFGALADETVVTTQLAGVRFEREWNMLPIVMTVGGVKIGQFSDCAGGIACEFPTSAARVLFATTQTQVSVELGLVPSSVPVDADVTLSALSTSGAMLATESRRLGPGSGFENVLSVSDAGGAIAAVTVHLSNPSGALLNTFIGVRSITLSASGNNAPAFSFDVPDSVVVVAGGGMTPVPVNLYLINGSTGAVSVSLAGLPSGMPSPGVVVFPTTASFFPLRAPASLAPTTTTITVTATPLTAAAGLVAHSRQVQLRVEPGLRYSGPIFLDAGGCAATDAAHGEIVAHAQIVRGWSFSGPVTVQLVSSDPNVVATADPQTLTFPGNIVGQNLNIRIRIAAGVDIPIAIIDATLVAAAGQWSFKLAVTGTCARKAQNFVALGTWQCHYKPLVNPVSHARVLVYRDVRWWFDDLMGSTFTKDDGSYEVNVSTSETSDYYAKLELQGDIPVSLDDSWSAGQPWSVETQRLSNSIGALDFGTEVISRDGGDSTPKCWIFSGSMLAWQELDMQLGERPPQDHYLIRIWSGFVSPISYREHTEWPDTYSPQIFNPPRGTDPFFDFKTNFHELGHSYRHFVDGDQDHWSWDNTRFFYGRIHHFCDLTNEGFAFNEGWAQYWAQQPRVLSANGVPLCGRDPFIILGGGGGFVPSPPTLHQIEGIVAEDLWRLQSCTGVSRGDMAKVLRTYGERIHSWAEYRDRFLEAFPGVDVSRCDAVLLGRASVVSSLRVVSERVGRRDDEAAGFAERLRAHVSRNVASQVQMTRALEQQSQNLAREATSARSVRCRAKKDCDALVRRLAQRPIVEGQRRLSMALEVGLQAELAALSGGASREPLLAMSLGTERLVSLEVLRRQVVQDVLREIRGQLKAAAGADRSGFIRRTMSELEFREASLRNAVVVDQGTLSIVPVPVAMEDDLVEGERPAGAVGAKPH